MDIKPQYKGSSVNTPRPEGPAVGELKGEVGVPTPGPTKPKSHTASPRPKEGVAVQVSSEAQGLRKSYDKAMQIAQQTPAVQEDKVAQLKTAIKNGTYEADSGHIADGMLREAIKDYLSGQTNQLQRHTETTT